MQFEPLLKTHNELVAKQAERDLQRASAPAKPEDYALDLPKGFELPEEFKDFQFNKDDPRLPAARQLAHELGWDQQTFSRLVGIQVMQDIAEGQRINGARDAEIKKLGPNSSARIDAVGTWFRAQNGGKDSALFGELATSGALQEAEALIKKFSSQGVAPFDGRHREQRKEDGKIDGYENMTFEQRRAAQINGATR